MTEPTDTENHGTRAGSPVSDCSAFVETPITDRLLQEKFVELGELGPHNCPEWLVQHARKMESEKELFRKALNQERKWDHEKMSKFRGLLRELNKICM